MKKKRGGANSAGRKRATLWNWIFWSGGGSSGCGVEEPTECATVGALWGADIKGSTPLAHTPGGTETRDDKTQVTKRFSVRDKRGSHSAPAIITAPCSARLQGLMAGPVRFTHILSWINHLVWRYVTHLRLWQMLNFNQSDLALLQPLLLFHVSLR